MKPPPAFEDEFWLILLQVVSRVVSSASQPHPTPAEIAGHNSYGNAEKDYCLHDIGIAAEHFCLQAAEEGLGTCMLGWFNERPLQKLLGIPKKRLIGLVITVGYPADEPRTKIRKTLDSIVAYNKYE